MKSELQLAVCSQISLKQHTASPWCLHRSLAHGASPGVVGLLYCCSTRLHGGGLCPRASRSLHHGPRPCLLHCGSLYICRLITAELPMCVFRGVGHDQKSKFAFCLLCSMKNLYYIRKPLLIRQIIQCLGWVRRVFDDGRRKQ
jgi:hypothetical protein